jgi:hypothetical protein
MGVMKKRSKAVLTTVQGLPVLTQYYRFETHTYIQTVNGDNPSGNHTIVLFTRVRVRDCDFLNHLRLFNVHPRLHHSDENQSTVLMLENGVLRFSRVCLQRKWCS